MKTLSTPAEVLGRLVVESPAKRLTTAVARRLDAEVAGGDAVVQVAAQDAEHKRLLRRAIRRGIH